MMESVFADTGHWLALGSVRDSLHRAATAAMAALAGTRVVTTEMVLVEFLNDRGSRGPEARRAALLLVQALRTNAKVHIVPQTPELFSKALALYTSRPDKSCSLTDCASFVVCRELGITQALAHDHHFEQAGLVALLRPHDERPSL